VGKACGLVLALISSLAVQMCAQKNSPSPRAAPLVLTGAIPLLNVKGRIDHLGFDPAHNRLFVSALGNNTEEIIGIGAQTVVHTISGVPASQGVTYSPETNKLFVGSDEGKLYVYDGTTFSLITSIDFGDDVDNLRYDAAEKLVYVGYGYEKTGAIGMVDAATNKRLDDEYKLGAHPESFQLADSGPNIYVNLPDLKQIAVVNRSTHSITRWPLTFESNFPMALDEPDHRLFVAARTPRLNWPCSTPTQVVWLLRFRLFKTRTTSITTPPASAFMFQAERATLVCFSKTTPITTGFWPKFRPPSGARTAGYFGKGRKRFDHFYLAVPARAERGAEVWIYTVQD
jgi:hypothetical protein